MNMNKKIIATALASGMVVTQIGYLGEVDQASALELQTQYTTENVNFSTVKQREMIKECNAPATNDLRNGFLQTGMNYYPVKYVSNIFFSLPDSNIIFLFTFTLKYILSLNILFFIKFW